MIDTDSNLPLVYGVWIVGDGWMRDSHGRIFSDMRREYADDALRMYRGNAQIVLIDDSMIELEPLFLERERAEIAAIEQGRLWNKAKRYINGLLGSGRK